MKSLTYIFLLFISVSVMAAVSQFNWNTPNKRVNGTPLLYNDIGGYELRGVDNSNKVVWSAIVPDRATRSYPISGIPSVPAIHKYQIAVYDVDGLYSDFVTITPTDTAVIILPPTNGEIF